MGVSIPGTGGPDSIAGTPGADTIFGNGGHDTVQANNGANLVLGGTGNDSLVGGNDADTLLGEIGNDTLNALGTAALGAGQLLDGGDGNDLIEGGLLFSGIDSADTRIGGNGNDTIFASGSASGVQANADQVFGGAGNDRLIIGDRYVEHVGLADGGAGNDTLATTDLILDATTRLVGIEAISGGARVTGTNTANLLDFGAFQLVALPPANPTGATSPTTQGLSLQGGLGADTIRGTGGADTINGGNGADSLAGGGGNDLIRGDAAGLADGANTLRGEDGNDTLFGNGGSTAAAAAAMLFGGNGDDILVVGETAPTAVGLADGGEGNDTLFGTEIHVAGATRLVGIEAFQRGLRIIDSGGGNLLDFSAVQVVNIGTNPLVPFPFASQDGILVAGGGGHDTLIGTLSADSLNGGTGNDLVTGGPFNSSIDRADTLAGDVGNDTLVSGGSLDSSGTGDVLLGGNGNDRLVVGRVTSETVQLADGGAGNDTLVTSELFLLDGTARLVGIEAITSGARITGAGLNSVLDFSGMQAVSIPDLLSLPAVATTVGITVFAGSGLNTVRGTLADDTLHGEFDRDLLEGGNGNDLLRGDAAGNAFANTLAGGQGDDTLFTGGGGAGAAAASVLQGGEGNDRLVLGTDAYETAGVIDGGAGDDTLVTSNLFIDDTSTRLLRIEAITAFALIDGFAGADLLDFGGIRTVTVADPLTGAATPTTGGLDILTYGGNDTVIGTLGNDLIDGAEDNDLLYGGLRAFADGTRPVDARDTLRGGGGHDTLFSHGNSTAAASADELSGGEGDDRIVVGLDLPEGLGFADGGEGNDTLVAPLLQLDNTTTRLAGFEAIAAGAQITGTGTGDLLDFTGLQTVFLPFLTAPFSEPTDSGIQVSGGGGADTVRGTEGSDGLLGGTGNDDIGGRGGYDNIQGDSGADTLRGDEGDDTINGDGHGGTAGADLVEGGNGHDLLFGDDGGGDAANTLAGGNGNDTLISGGFSASISVADRLLGGEGNDRFGLGGAVTPEAVGLVDGGGGEDTLVAINIALDATTRLVGIEAISGSASISGNSVANLLDFGGFAVVDLAGPTGPAAGPSAFGLIVATGGGADTVIGTLVADHVMGGTGNDLVRDAAANFSGEMSADTLAGEDGNDTLISAASSFGEPFPPAPVMLLGGNGNDLLVLEPFLNATARSFGLADGGAGSDTLSFQWITLDSTTRLAGIEAVLAGSRVDGTDGADLLDFAAIAPVGPAAPLGLTLNAGLGADTVRGTLGHDVIEGGSGPDRLEGGNGNDTITNDDDGFDFAEDTLLGGDGDDSLDGGFGADSLAGDAGNDTLRGDEGADSLAGGNGHDSLSGDDSDADAFSDLLDGDDGDDTLVGRSGADTLRGGNGHDSLVGGEDSDLLDGGGGNDTLDGGDQPDTLRGGEGDDVLRAHVSGALSPGQDRLEGGNGNDLILGGFIDVGGNANQTLMGEDGNDTIASDVRLPGEFEPISDRIEGGNGDDRVFVLNGATLAMVQGGAGNDTLVAGEAEFRDGSGVSGVEAVSSGARFTGDMSDNLMDFAGLQAVSIAGTPAILANTLPNPLLPAAYGAPGLAATIGLDLDGREGNDTIRGTNAADTLRGDTGNDSLDGGGGNDRLETGLSGDGGGGGADTALGGDGDDTLVSAPVALDGHRLSGGNGNDVIVLAPESTFGAFAGLVDGGAGNDTLDASFLQLDTSTRLVGIEAIVADRIIQGTGAANLLDFGTVAAVLGSVGTGFTPTALGIRIVGEEGNDTIRGTTSADRLEGGVGADSLVGGTGDDTLIGDVSFFADAANTLSGGDGNDALFSGGNLTTTALADRLFGGNGDDWLVVGTAAAESAGTLDGGAGNDTLFTANLILGGTAQLVGIEAISGGAAISGTGVANLLDFSALQTVVVSNALVSTATTAGLNVLAFGGHDTVTGTAGNDRLDGGTGNDIVTGGGTGAPSGADTLVGEAGNDTLVSGGGGTLPGQADMLFGGNGNDHLAVGLHGAEAAGLIDGGAGNDTLLTTTLVLDQMARLVGIEAINGGAAIQLAGGGGGIFNFAVLQIVAIAGVTPAGAISGLVIRGGTGNDTVFGTGLDDRFEILPGADVILAGAGNDTILAPALIADPAGDTVRGEGGTDLIEGSGTNDDLAGGQGADTLRGGGGADTLRGEFGRDLIEGGNGADWIVGGALGETSDAADTLVGDDGNDTLVTLGTDSSAGAAHLLSGGNGDDLLSIGYYTTETVGTVDGGAGNDTLQAFQVFLDGTARITGIEAISSGAQIIGTEAANLLDFAAFQTVYVENLTTPGVPSATGLIVQGAAGADTLRGTAGNDTLGGDDTTAAFADSLMGGNGDDWLFGDGSGGTLDSANTLMGEDGNDILVSDGASTATAAADRLFGGNGDDRLFIGAFGLAEGVALADGGAGNDTLVTYDLVIDGTARLVGIEAINVGARITGTGVANLFDFVALQPVLLPDFLSAGTPSAIGVFVSALGGNDTILGTTGADTLLGDSGSDSILGGDGDDLLDPGSGPGQVFGGAGVDTVSLDLSAATTSVTVAVAGGIVTALGSIVIQEVERLIVTGGNGNDRITGLDGADTLAGGAGADSIQGGLGDDLLLGGTGTDTIVGGGGADVLLGGIGADRLVASLDGFLDRVRYLAPDEGGDVVVAFATGEDVFEFSRTGFGLAPATAIGDILVIGAGAAALPGSTAALLYDPTTGLLSFDADGAGAGGVVLLASLGAGTVLNATDLTLIG